LRFTNRIDSASVTINFTELEKLKDRYILGTLMNEPEIYIEDEKIMHKPQNILLDTPTLDFKQNMVQYWNCVS
jgi:hypothetical protein